MTDQLTLPPGISDLEGTEPVVTGKPDWWTINLIGIAAVAERGVIGARGKIPWHYPEDMAHFKEHTSGPGKAVIMGRLTWDSLPVNKATGEKLPGRKKIVLTRSESQLSSVIKDTWFTNSVDFNTWRSVLADAKVKDLYVIGGGTVYDRLIRHMNRLILTHIPLNIVGDTFFPPLKPGHWVIDKEYLISPVLQVKEIVPKYTDSDDDDLDLTF